MYNIHKTVSKLSMHMNTHTFHTRDKKAFYHMHVPTSPIHPVYF